MKNIFGQIHVNLWMRARIMRPRSRVFGHLLEADEAVVVLGLSPGFNVLVATWSKSAVNSGTQGVSLDEIIELIILVVALSHELERSLVAAIVTNCFQNHIISFLKSNKSDILHGLHEWHDSSETLFSFILLMGGEGLSTVQVEAAPQVHAEHEAEEVLWQSAVDEWSIIEKIRSLLLAIVPVPEHRGVRIVVVDPGGSLLRNTIH